MNTLKTTLALVALALAGFAGFAGEASAQNAKNTIVIDAENGVDWLKDQRTYKAYGNAKVAIKDQFNIASDEIEYEYGADAGDIVKLKTFGHSTLETKTQVLTSDLMVIDEKLKEYELDGQGEKFIKNADFTVTSQGKITARDAAQKLVALDKVFLKMTDGDSDVSGNRIEANYTGAFMEDMEIKNLVIQGKPLTSTDGAIASGEKIEIADNLIKICAKSRFRDDKTTVTADCITIDKDVIRYLGGVSVQLSE